MHDIHRGTEPVAAPHTRAGVDSRFRTNFLSGAICVFSASVLLWVWEIWLRTPDELTHIAPDDMYYYLQVAQNIAHGNGSTFDGRNLTNGYHPLWMVLCATLAYGIATVTSLEPDVLPRAALTLEVVLGTLGTFQIARAIRNVADSRLAAAVAVLIASCPFVIYSFRDGMESGLVLFLQGSLFLLMDRWRLFASCVSFRDTVFGLVLAALVLARLDLCFQVLVLFGFGWLVSWRNALDPFGHRWQRGVRFSRIRRLFESASKPVLWTLPVVLSLSAYLCINCSIFDSALPINGVAKSGFPHLQPLTQHLWHYAITAALAATIGVVISAIHISANALIDFDPAYWLMVGALSTSVHVLYTLAFQLSGVWPYYFTSSWVFGVMCWSIIADRWIRPRWAISRRRASVFFGVAATCALAGNLVFVASRRDASGTPCATGAQRIDQVISNSAIIGMNNAGCFAYYRGHGVTNLDGLVNNFDYLTRLRQEGGFAKYLAAEGIGYVGEIGVEPCSYEKIDYLPGVPGYRGKGIEVRKTDEVLRIDFRSYGYHVPILGLMGRRQPMDSCLVVWKVKDALH